MTSRLLIAFLFLLVSHLNLHAQKLVFPVDTFPVIDTMMGMVDTNIFLGNVHHLQDYGTRECFSPEAIQAQNWLKDIFESYSLSVELQDFLVWIWDPSDNVIATFPGKVTPDEYVILGAHYDSYTGGPFAQGADDNASGTAGVLEVSRILTQYQFEKTIIFCAFSAEEYGLFGSEAYAARCEQEGMNILGYINMDMIGYHAPGQVLHSDMIAPPSAQELAQFYINVAAIYLPGFPIYNGSLTGGDSDHTSFNNHGYMGIFPFEDDEFHSPYIHTDEDTIGPSLNSAELALHLMRAGLASVVTLAIPYTPVGIEPVSCPESIVYIFPNPAHSKIQISLKSEENISIQLHNLTGKLVFQDHFTHHTILNVGQLPRGAYSLTLKSSTFQVVRKVILQ